MQQNNQNQLAPIQQINNLILSQESIFNSVNSAPNDIAFYREAEFATQLLQANDFLLKTAISNRDSLVNAIKNVAAIGISLNPAQKLAYLVPRDRQVKLDISYHGLIWLAVEAGAIQWAQAKIVYASDQYQNTGIDSEPLHKYNPFDKNRGEILGAYVVAKTSSGDFLTHEMSISDIYAIRERSPSFKGGRSSPWKTDEAAMIKKTVVRQASTYWPKVARLRTAEEYLNTQMDQGIDLNGNTHTNAVASPKDVSVINGLLGETQTDWSVLIGYASNSLGMSNAQTPGDLTPGEATKIIGMLEHKKEVMKNAQSN